MTYVFLLTLNLRQLQLYLTLLKDIHAEWVFLLKKTDIIKLACSDNS